MGFGRLAGVRSGGPFPSGCDSTILEAGAQRAGPGRRFFVGVRTGPQAGPARQSLDDEGPAPSGCLPGVERVPSGLVWFPSGLVPFWSGFLPSFPAKSGAGADCRSVNLPTLRAPFGMSAADG